MNGVVQPQWGQSASTGAGAGGLYFPSPGAVDFQLGKLSHQPADGPSSPAGFYHLPFLPRCSLSTSDNNVWASPSPLLSTPATTTIGAGFSSYPSSSVWNGAAHNDANDPLTAAGGYGSAGKQHAQQPIDNDEPPSVITFFLNLPADDDVSVLHDDPDHDDQGVLPQTTYDVLQNLFQGMDDESEGDTSESEDEESIEQDAAMQCEPQYGYGIRGDIRNIDIEQDYVDSRDDWVGGGA